MFKNLLSSIENVDVFAIVALIIFVIVFGIGVYKALTLSKKHVDEVSKLPLDDDKNNRTGDDKNE